MYNWKRRRSKISSSRSIDRRTMRSFKTLKYLRLNGLFKIVERVVKKVGIHADIFRTRDTFFLYKIHTLDVSSVNSGISADSACQESRKCRWRTSIAFHLRRVQRATCLGALDSVNIVVVHLGLGQYTSTIRRYSFARTKSEGKKGKKFVKVGTRVKDRNDSSRQYIYTLCV